METEEVGKPQKFLSNLQENNFLTGGRLRIFKDKWARLTTDQNILEIISGYHLEFDSGGPPHQDVTPQPYRFDPQETSAVDEEISRLCKKGVIEPAGTGSGFVSNIFTRPKKNGTYRMILDLSELNESIQYYHFKMDTFESALKLITKNCYLTSIDLRDAYYMIPIAVEHKKYLRFVWRGATWQFKALPNGLTSGPRIFTKLFKIPLAHLRQMGFNIISYIDDTLLVANTKEQANIAVENTVHILSDLGFIIHPEKSVFEPTQKLEFLGFVIDTKLMQVRLTDERIIDIKQSCNSLLSKGPHKIRSVASTVGKLVASFSGSQFGPLYYRQIEKEKTEALRKHCGNFDKFMSLSIMANRELKWWLANVASMYRTIDKGPITMQITSDASGLGWGATDGTVEIGGRWNSHELIRANRNEINYLETLAAFHALRSFFNPGITNCHILLRMDNTTAVAYINHMGGTKSIACNELAKTIWEWCITRKIWITAAHVPGVDNSIADKKSRIFNDNLEWMLHVDIFRNICETYGTPDIDLFASRLNAQLTRYVSWKPDPTAEAIDAFTINWGNLFFYAFPPFSLILRCLQKVEQDQADGIIIVPKWPTQPWFSKLLHLLIDTPLILPNTKGCLTQPTTGKNHPLRNQMFLLCCRLSGKCFKTADFQRKQQASFSLHGDPQQKPNTAYTSESGCIFALNGTPIQCKPMFYKY